MPDDTIQHAFDLLGGPRDPATDFRDRLWEQLLDERRGVSPAPGRRGSRSSELRPRRRNRRFLSLAAALTALVVALGVVVLAPRPPSALAIVQDARQRFTELPSMRVVVERIVPGQTLSEEVLEEVPDWTQVTEISYGDDRHWRREILEDTDNPFEPQGQVGAITVFSPEGMASFDPISGQSSIDPSSETSDSQSRLEALREIRPSLDQVTPVSDAAIETCEVLEDAAIAGREAHHLRCSFDTGLGGEPAGEGAEAWIDTETGVVLKLTFPSGYSFEVRSIEYDATFPPDTFSFEPGGVEPPTGGSASDLDTGIELGQEVPTWTLPLVGGGDLDLASLRGKPAIVYVWASWCPVCYADQSDGPQSDPLRAVDDAYATHGSDIGVVALAFADDNSAVTTIFDQEDYTVPVAVSEGTGGLPEMFGGLGVPMLVVIDADGGLAGAYLGVGGDDVRAIVAAILAGEPLPHVGGQTKELIPG